MCYLPFSCDPNQGKIPYLAGNNVWLVCHNEIVGAFSLCVFLMPWLQSPNHPLNLDEFRFQSVFPEHRTVSSFRMKVYLPLESQLELLLEKC